MKTLLRSLVVLVGIVLALLAIVVALVLTMDPNRLKPLLEKQAAQRGIDLHMPGDLSWTFFPSIGLSLGAVDVRTLEEKEELASIQEAQVTVQLMPLLKRKIFVDGIRLDGLEVSYLVDKNGKSAWQTLGSEGDVVDEPPASEESSEGGAVPELSVNRVDISNLKLTYVDEQAGSRAEISDLNLTATEVALDGKAFPLSLALKAKWADLPQVDLSWQGPVAVDLDAQTLTVSDAAIQVRTEAAKLAMTLSTQTFWGEPLSSKGTFALAPTSIPPLLKVLKMEAIDTAKKTALHNVGANLKYEYGADALELNGVEIILDQTRINGQLQVKNFDKPSIVTEWQGTHLVLDDYLPPVSEEAETAAPVEAPPQPLPFETLRALDLNAKIGFDKITFKGLDINALNVRTTAQKGLIKLDTLNMKVAEGSIDGDGQLDARGKEAQLKMQLKSQGVNLETLLKTFADLDKIAGKAAATIAVTSHGATDKALIDNLVVEATAESAELRVVPINIEEQFCRAVALLQQQTLPENFEWPSMTLMEPVQMKLQYANNVLNVQQLSAEIAHLVGAASGTFNVEKGEFDFPFSLSLGNFAGEMKGCLPIEEKWRKRALPIRCQGSLDNIGIKTCLPDTKLITDMIKDKVTAEAKEKLAAEKERLEEKVESKAKELIQEKLGEDKKESVRGILNQLRGKQNEPAAPKAETTEQ